MPPQFANLEISEMIRDLRQNLAFWLEKWRTIGDRLSGSIGYLSTLPEGHPDLALASELSDSLTQFHQSFTLGLITSLKVQEFLHVCREFEKRAAEIPGWDQAGRISGIPHRLKNVIASLSLSEANIKRLVEKLLKYETIIAPEFDLWQLMKLSSQKMLASDFSVDTVSSLLNLCETLGALFPHSTYSVPQTLSATLRGKTLILVVEDDNTWLPEIEAILKGTEQAYAKRGPDIFVRSARTYEGALLILKSHSTSEDEPRSVLLILDFGIPKDDDELISIETDRSTVGREWGRALLKEARAYRERCNVIILTTKTNYPDDFNLALRSGIRPENFILKDESALSDLRASIQSVFAPQKAPRVEFILETANNTRVNSIEVELGRHHFRTLYVLARNRRRALNIQEISEELSLTYPEEDSYNQRTDLNSAWRAAQERAEKEGFSRGSTDFFKRANEINRVLVTPIITMECWQEVIKLRIGETTEPPPDNQQIEQDGKHTYNRRLLIAFHRKCQERNYGLSWNWFITEFKQYGFPDTSPFYWGESQVNEAYRVISSKLVPEKLTPHSFNPRIIHDHIYRIRHSIYQATGLDPTSVVSTSDEEDNNYRYRFIAEPVFINSLSAIRESLPLQDDDRCRVLVVENEDMWLEEIRSILNKGNYAIEVAKTVVDAIRVAKKFLPHILCLDLHLPSDDEDLRLWQEDGVSGIATGGLTVLSEVQSFDPRVRGIILSDLANDDKFRLLAARAGVNYQTIISKEASTSEYWGSSLLRAVWHSEQEIRRGVFFVQNDEDIPFIAISLDEELADSKLIRVKSADKTSTVQLGTLEYRLLSLFRENGHLPIPREKLLIELYGERWPEKQEAFDNVIKRLRAAIVKNGLGLTGTETRRAGTRLILHTEGSYLCKFKLY